MKTITLYQFSIAKKISYKECIDQYLSGQIKDARLVGKKIVVNIDETFPNFNSIKEFKDKKINICIICNSHHYGRGETCSKKCQSVKTKRTNIEKFGTECPCSSPEISKKIREDSLKKYGVSFPSNSLEAKEKRKKTCIEKYGSEFVISSEEIRKKSKSKILEKYGVENAFQSPEILEKIKKTCLDKYGTEHFFQSEHIKEKIKTTNMEKYGVDNPAKSDILKAKAKETCLKKYGTEHHSQSLVVKEKISATNILKYGTACSLNNPIVKEKSESTIYKKYGVKNSFQSKIIRLKCSDTIFKKYGVRSLLQLKDVRLKAASFEARRKRRLTLKLNRSYKQSRPENNLFEVLCGLFGSNVERQVEVKSWEIDFYIPSISTYINFNGVYWHGRYLSPKDLEDSKTLQSKKILETKYRDIARENFFKQNEINFIVIWEDDFKADPVNSVLDALSHSGIMRWRKVGIYEIPDLHPGKLFSILQKGIEK